MPLCTLYLVELDSVSSIDQFISGLEAQPVLVSRVLRWAIRPSAPTASNEYLLSRPWTLLLVFEGATDLERISRRDFIKDCWAVTAGVPGSILKSFRADNASLLKPKQEDVPELTGSLKDPKMRRDSQNLELSDELFQWIKEYSSHVEGGGGAVSMLNLLAFKPGSEMRESYQRYGQAFAQSAGSRRGGRAKIVGTVVAKQGEIKVWDEIAIAHYPSAWHFADMAASDDYQEANHRWRLPALADTCILATSEVRLDDPNVGLAVPHSKL